MKFEAVTKILKEEDIKREPLGSGYFALTAPGFTFTSDAILLADFASKNIAGSNTRVCDLCAGCGIISLLFCADGKRPQIASVEIQKDACTLLEKAKIENNINCINVINNDLNNLDTSIFGKFDLVACNPPYKKSGTGGKSSALPSLAARHEEFCTLEDVIKTSSKLLDNGGKLCLCQRPERLCDIITLMRLYKVEPKRIRFVQQKVTTKPWLLLVEGKKNAKAGLIAEPVLIVENSGEYSEEMQKIYNKFSH